MTKTIILIFTIILAGCGFGGGTHGSIKGYHYSVTKDELEKAVNTVIKKDQLSDVNSMAVIITTPKIM